MNFRKSEMSAMEVDNQLLVDPFIALSVYVHDLIWQHFTGKEAMDLSTVSKQWNYNIGVSSAAMIKIMLVYDAASKDVTPILTSQRRYYDVKLKGLSIPRKTRSCSGQLQVVEKISGSVKDLEVVESTIGDFDLAFPKLEVLKYCDNMLCGSSIRSILNGVTASKLKVLEMRNVYDIQYLKKILMKCNKLEEFKLGGLSTALWFFASEAATFPFKLKKFTISFYFPEWTPNMLTYFEKFLQTQSSLLQCLRLLSCNTNLLAASLKLLTSLKELEIYYPIASDFRFPVNSSVGSLICLNCSVDSLQSILTALPNLKSLTVANYIIITSNMIDTIASFALNLHTVVYQKCNINVEEYYEALKIQRPEVNQQIQWTSNR